MRTKAILVFLLLLPVAVMNGQDNKREYLEKVLGNLERVKSAAYNDSLVVWERGDTIPLFTRNNYIEEYDNPQDSTIGASFVEYENMQGEKVFM